MAFLFRGKITAAVPDGFLLFANSWRNGGTGGDCGFLDCGSGIAMYVGYAARTRLCPTSADLAAASVADQGSFHSRSGGYRGACAASSPTRQSSAV